MTFPGDLRRLQQDVGKLLDEHDDGRPLESFARWAEDPVGFDERSDRDPTDYQRQIMESVRDNKFTVVRGCHASGKEWTAGSLAVWAAYARRMLVLVVSATERQVIGQTMREVRAAWRAATDLPGQLYTGSVRIGGEDRIIALTGGANIDALTGWHDANGVLVIISEGQGERLEDSAYDSAFANASDDRSRVLAMGNPVRPVGRFYEIHQRPHWHAIQVSAFDTPNVMAGETVRHGFPSPGWPQEVADEYGETSAYYTSRVLAEFPTSGSIDALFERPWVEAAFARWDPDWRPGPRPAAALDVARSHNRDESVCCLVQGRRVHSFTAWRSRDLTATADRFAHLTDAARLEWFIERRGNRLDASSPTLKDPTLLTAYLDASVPRVPAFPLVIDAPGIGGGVIDILRRRGRSIAEWWGWRPARDSERFANARAEAYWAVRELLQNDELAVPPDEAFMEECLAVTWSLDSRGRIIMAPKDDIRSALNRSPDRLDSCAMGLAAADGALDGPSVSFSSLRI